MSRRRQPFPPGRFEHFGRRRRLSPVPSRGIDSKMCPTFVREGHCPELKYGCPYFHEGLDCQEFFFGLECKFPSQCRLEHRRVRPEIAADRSHGQRDPRNPIRDRVMLPRAEHWRPSGDRYARELPPLEHLVMDSRFPADVQPEPFADLPVSNLPGSNFRRSLLDAHDRERELLVDRDSFGLLRDREILWERDRNFHGVTHRLSPRPPPQVLNRQASPQPPKKRSPPPSCRGKSAAKKRRGKRGNTTFLPYMPVVEIHTVLKWRNGQLIPS